MLPTNVGLGFSNNPPITQDAAINQNRTDDSQRKRKRDNSPPPSTNTFGPFDVQPRVISSHEVVPSPSNAFLLEKLEEMQKQIQSFTAENASLKQRVQNLEAEAAVHVRNFEALVEKVDVLAERQRKRLRTESQFTPEKEASIEQEIPLQTQRSASVGEVADPSIELSPQSFPDELKLLIFRYLNECELGICSLVCRHWEVLCRDNSLWKPLFMSKFAECNGIKDYKKAYQEAYQEQVLIRSNMVSGRHALKTLQGHQDAVSALAIANGMLFSGSYDKTIKMWDLKTLQYVHTFEGHKDRIRSLAAADGMLFSGSFDKTIKMWDLKTLQCVHTFEGHEGCIRSLAIADGMLFSSSSDQKIKMWDLKTLQCEFTFDDCADKVHAVAIANGMLFLGSATIIKWDLKTHRYVQILEGHKDWVKSLAIADGMLFSGSNDNEIKMWDLKTLQWVHTFEGHRFGVTSLAIANGILFSGSYDTTVKMWDLKTLQCVNTFIEHEHEVRTLAFANGELFSGSSDGAIRVLNFKETHEEILEDIAK